MYMRCKHYTDYACCMLRKSPDKLGFFRCSFEKDTDMSCCKRYEPEELTEYVRRLEKTVMELKSTLERLESHYERHTHDVNHSIFKRQSTTSSCTYIKFKRRFSL